MWGEGKMIIIKSICVSCKEDDNLVMDLVMDDENGESTMIGNNDYDFNIVTEEYNESDEIKILKEENEKLKKQLKKLKNKSDHENIILTDPKEIFCPMSDKELRKIKETKPRIIKNDKWKTNITININSDDVDLEKVVKQVEKALNK